MHPCRVPLLGCFQAQHQHVEDDPDIDCDNQRANPVWPAQQVGHLERDVDGARSNGHPLRPGADVPQAVGLHEAKDHVDRRHDRDLPQAHVAAPVHQVDEDSDVVVERIDVEQFQETLRDSPDIHVPHGEHTKAREDYDDPFCELNGGDSAHAFDVFGIVNYRMRDYRMRDYGMHLRPNILWAVRDGASPVSTGVFCRFSRLLSNGGAQLLGDLQSGFMGGFALGDVEGDCSYSGVASAAITLADSRQIDGWRALRPRDRSDGNFYPERTLADAEALSRVGLQLLGNELAVAFEVEIGDVEKNRAVLFYAALPKNLDGALMAFEQRRQDGGYEGLVKNAGKGLVR